MIGPSTKTGDVTGSVVINGNNSGPVYLMAPSAASSGLRIYLPPAPDRHDPATRFQYTARRTTFLGRDDEMRRLHDFRGGQEPFQWWLVAGQGGMGKSRLALQCCDETPQPWTRGFLILEEEHKQTDPTPLRAVIEPLAQWQPDAPTLIVVDYVVERATFLGMLIRTLAHRNDLAHPVRLFLVEREAEGQWRQAFNAADSVGQKLMDQARHDAPLVLGQPNDDALFSIIKTMSNDVATDKADALAQLKTIDPQARPLFAALLGDALAQYGSARRWDRTALMKDVIEHNVRHFWTPNGITDADKALLCLATLTSGALAEWLNSPVIPPDTLPRLDDPGLMRRYRVMTGQDIAQVGDPDNPRSLFPPLQPDLLGEFFVLHHLAPKGQFPEVWRPRLKAFVNAAWSLDAQGTAVFLNRLGADFPDHPALRDLFALPEPKTAKERLLWAMVKVNQGVRLGKTGDSRAEIAIYDDIIPRLDDATEPKLREILAAALFNKAVTLDKDGDSGMAVAIYDDIIRRFDNATEPKLRQQLAKAMVNKAVALGQNGDNAAEIAVYDHIIRRFDDTTQPGPLQQLAIAMVNKAISLGETGDSVAAIAACDAMIHRFDDAVAPELLEQLAKVMASKATILGKANDTATAIDVYDAVIRRFDHATEAELRTILVTAMVNKAVALDKTGDNAAVIAACDGVIRRFDDATEPEQREQLVRAMHAKAVALDKTGDAAAAIAVYDDMIHRFDGTTEPELREIIAKAMVNKGITLGENGHSIAVYDHVIRRFGDATEPELREIIAKAMLYKAVVLGKADDSVTAIAVCEDIITLFAQAPEPALQQVMVKARELLALLHLMMQAQDGSTDGAQ